MANTEAGHAGESPKCVAFVFGMAAGHVNPSLPVARGLVKLGHEVHYLCREQMRGAIEDTGAKFHSEIENETELYSGRDPGMLRALLALKEEHGMADESLVTASLKLQEIAIEMQLPGVVRWLRQIGADAVVYCPLMNQEAALAGKVLGIPRVAFLTTAGPGSIVPALDAMLAPQGLTPLDVLEMRKAFPPCRESIDRLNAEYGLKLRIGSSYEPVGRLESLALSTVTLVTTSEDLQDPMPPELAQAYEEAKVRFVAVGPLLDVAGAQRAAGHKFTEAEEQGQQEAEAGQPDPVASLKEARALGRKVVLMSMGTVITGDNSQWGWKARLRGPDGQPTGLTGEELCQAAWGGGFDAFAAEAPGEGPLVLVALGPQRDALGELRVPPNALCLPTLPQVDLLKAGVDVFLTHGGQNSLTEALSAGVPVVVCPGFGDQCVNARKAARLGVGLGVDRPMPAAGQEAAAAAAYREEVASALRTALGDQRFRDRAAHSAEQLRTAGGVPRAIALVVEAATSGGEGRA